MLHSAEAIIENIPISASDPIALTRSQLPTFSGYILVHYPENQFSEVFLILKRTIFDCGRISAEFRFKSKLDVALKNFDTIKRNMPGGATVSLYRCTVEDLKLVRQTLYFLPSFQVHISPALSRDALYTLVSCCDYDRGVVAYSSPWPCKMRLRPFGGSLGSPQISPSDLRNFPGKFFLYDFTANMAHYDGRYSAFGTGLDANLEGFKNLVSDDHTRIFIKADPKFNAVETNPVRLSINSFESFRSDFLKEGITVQDPVQVPVEESSQPPQTDEAAPAAPVPGPDTPPSETPAPSPLTSDIPIVRDFCSFCNAFVDSFRRVKNFRNRNLGHDLLQEAINSFEGDVHFKTIPFTGQLFPYTAVAAAFSAQGAPYLVKLLRFIWSVYERKYPSKQKVQGDLQKYFKVFYSAWIAELGKMGIESDFEQFFFRLKTEEV